MVCLRHRSFKHKPSLVCHKTKSLKNHGSNINDKCQRPPPHSDHHEVHIRPDLKQKTKASVGLLQGGDALRNLNQKVPPAVSPKIQSRNKHRLHPRAKYTSGSKHHTKPKRSSLQKSKSQNTILPLISGKTPPHCQIPTGHLLMNTNPGPEQTTTIMSSAKHLSEIQPDPDAQDTPPLEIFHQGQMPLNKEECGTFPRLLNNQAKDPINQNHQKITPLQTETPTSDYNQAKDTPRSSRPYKAQSQNQNQTQPEQNRDVPLDLNKINPHTIVDGITLNTQIVDKIINTIPEAKIKHDLYNQIHLWQLRGCPRPATWPGQYMSASYTVCLICASWIPNGCPHVGRLKCFPLAQLLAIPTPLHDSEQKNVRFYLKVTQGTSNSVSVVTNSLPSKAMPSVPLLAPPSCGNSDPSPLLVLPKLTWLDFILAKHHQSNKVKSYPNQKPFELPLRCQRNVEEIPMKQKMQLQFKSLLEKFQSKRREN
ncbi:casein kinase II subunit alpha'-interacting protein-like [Monodelphis domestica]|uniref:casein kinase II subunit alpha'-interacting protein-like n=1 Tax=Monodelphis domestica TaxID=13616 RepID=UPI0024E1C705|nr:casein kinase II subunit alpha'-interacting protein-like [Monodelphis domestica]XP_056649268.1 casein kinase II subunit alpha'-interacting protein-like [Monodelphis domestica]